MQFSLTPNITYSYYMNRKCNKIILELKVRRMPTSYAKELTLTYSSLFLIFLRLVFMTFLT
jgi:hypothetical protein